MTNIIEKINNLCWLKCFINVHLIILRHRIKKMNNPHPITYVFLVVIINSSK